MALEKQIFLFYQLLEKAHIHDHLSWMYSCENV